MFLFMQVIGLTLTVIGVFLWAVWSCFWMNCGCCQPIKQLRKNIKGEENEDRSDIIKSRDVSLLSKHLQKEIEADVERQIQELAKERATVITATRVRELRRALEINDQPEPDGAPEIDDQPQSPPDEGAPSTQSCGLTDEPGQEGKASATDHPEDQPGPSFSPGVNVQPQHQSEPEAGERAVLLNNPDEGALLTN